jgi:putative transposase
VKYAFVTRHKREWPISLMCKVLEVSVSGYFESVKRFFSKEAKAKSKRVNGAVLLAHIKVIDAQVKGEYGWPRMWRELQARGILVGKSRVHQTMKAHGIKARGKRKFVVTTDSRHNLPIAENLLNRQFTPEAPDQVWTSDITYIETGEGWLYLAAVIDLYSRLGGGLDRAIALQSPCINR